MSPEVATAAGERIVVVHPDAGTLAAACAARLLTRLLDVQSVRTPAHVVLTGGTVGIAVLAEIARSPLRDAVDWSGVHLWWGDERYLPAGDADRNETQARVALIEALGDALPPANVHPMPASDAPGIGSPEDSAAAYAVELARFAAPAGAAADGAAHVHGAVAVPAFDVLMLGVGPDGHVASLFPGHEAVQVTGVATVAVHGSPKPPPERVSLTFDAIRAAHEVWLVAAGSEKAAVIAAALAGAAVDQVPAAGALGSRATRCLLDAQAATPSSAA